MGVGENVVSQQSSEVAQAAVDACGLNVQAYDEAFLSKTMGRRQVALGLSTQAEYRAWLEQSPSELLELRAALLIGYSAFFRNSLSYAVVEQCVLPALATAVAAAGRSEIRVWSAGCASGQEPWSIAMLLEDFSSALSQPLAYRIFATDVCETSLDEARAGRYAVESVGNIRSRHLREYFEQDGEVLEVCSRLRDRVSFSRHDLLDKGCAFPVTSIYGGFDLVFCCNVLFYYRAGVRRFVLDRLVASLCSGGYLVSGETERESVSQHRGLLAVASPSAVFQRKARI